MANISNGTWSFMLDCGGEEGHIIGIVLLNIISLLAGIIGNIMAVVIIARNKDYFQGIHVFIIALALTDLSVCFVVQPILVVVLLSSIPETTALQDFEDNVFAVLTQISMNLLLTVALMRIVEITRPFFYNSFATNSRMVMITAFVCVISTLQGLLFNTDGFLSATEPFFQYATILGFVVIYVIIYKVAWTHSKIIAAQTRSVAFNRRLVTATRYAHIRRSTLTTGIITGAFLVCFLPFSVVNLISEREIDFCTNKKLSTWVTTLACCNSSMNAYIYTLRSRSYKQQLIKTLRSLKCFKKKNCMTEC